MKQKIISLLFHNTLLDFILMLVFLFSLVGLTYIGFTNAPKSVWWAVDIVINILGILVICYAVYFIIRFTLVFVNDIGKDDSVIDFFKKTVRELRK